MNHRKPLPMRIGAVVFAVLFLTALVPPSALADHRAAGTNFVEVRAEERQVAVYDERGNLKSATTTGKIIANNTEDKELQSVRIDLTNLTGTNLTSPVFADLPPGESVVATYSVTAQPRLALSEGWKSITYQEKIEELRSQGRISDATAARHLANLKQLFFGVPNQLEFNVTIENRGPDAGNVTVADLLPDAFVNPSLISATLPGAYATANLSYDGATDSILIPRFPSGTSTTLTFRGTLPAVTDPADDFVNLSKTTTATYETRVEATQSFAQPVSPEVAETLSALGGTFNNTTSARAALAALTPGLVPAAESLDSAAAAGAAGNPAQMDAQLPQVRGQLESAAAALANLSGSTAREGGLLARLLELLNVSVPQSEVQSRVNQIASQGLPSELQDILRAEGFTDADLLQLRQFITNNAALLGGMNLSEAYAFAGEKHFGAAQGYGLASFKGLENAVFVNKTLGRTKSPFEMVVVSPLRPSNCPYTLTFPTVQTIQCTVEVAPLEPPNILARIKEGGGFRYNLISGSLTGSDPNNFDLAIRLRVTRLSDGQVVLDREATTNVLNFIMAPVELGNFDGVRLKWIGWSGLFPFAGAEGFPPRPGILIAPDLQVVATADPELAALNAQAVTLRSELVSAAAGATADSDFASIRDRASQLSDLSFQLASRSGQFNYADLYNASHNAKLAALRGLAGDPEGAARVLRNITFSPHLVAWNVPPDRSLALPEAGKDLNLTVGITSWRGEAASGQIEVDVFNGTGPAGTVRCDFEVPASAGPTPVENQLHDCTVPGSLLAGPLRGPPLAPRRGRAPAGGGQRPAPPAGRHAARDPHPPPPRAEVPGRPVREHGSDRQLGLLLLLPRQGGRPGDLHAPGPRPERDRLRPRHLQPRHRQPPPRHPPGAGQRHHQGHLLLPVPAPDQRPRILLRRVPRRHHPRIRRRLGRPGVPPQPVPRVHRGRGLQPVPRQLPGLRRPRAPVLPGGVLHQRGPAGADTDSSASPAPLQTSAFSRPASRLRVRQTGRRVRTS
ncbi:MAG: hypothetical protein QXO51_05345 [Halobacteria archaeon]